MIPKQSDLSLKDLSRNKDLAEAVQYLKCSYLDFLDTKPPTDTQEVQSKFTVTKTMYSITDFVIKPNQGPTTEDKKKSVEHVTAAQWISANARILQRLISDGLQGEDIQRYLRYTSKIGDYLQMAEISSVMVLDHQHRMQVHEENRPWDMIDSDKVYFHLKHSTFPVKPVKPQTSLFAFATTGEIATCPIANTLMCA